MKKVYLKKHILYHKNDVYWNSGWHNYIRTDMYIKGGMDFITNLEGETVKFNLYESRYR